MTTKINTLETKKVDAETWTDRDMFKWAVHLQRDNPQIKVPEPDMHSAKDTNP